MKRPRPICPREACGSTHVTVGAKYGICNRCCVKAPREKFFDYPMGSGERRQVLAKRRHAFLDE